MRPKQGFGRVAVASGTALGALFAVTVSSASAAPGGIVAYARPASGTVKSSSAKRVPPAPTITSVVPGNDELMLTVTVVEPTSGPPVTSVTATCGTQSAAFDEVDPSGQILITVTGLTNGTKYHCKAYATSSTGKRGPTSKPVTGRPELVVPGEPSITSVWPGDGSLTVIYTLAPGFGAIITSYTATCGTQSATVNGDVDSDLYHTTSWDTVTGLTDGTSYSCTVYATNPAGNGPPSAPVSGTPNSVASSPTPSAGGVFVAVSCPTASECVAVGAGAASSANPPGLVEVSSNGGETFTDEPVPTGTPQLNDVTCLDAMHCLAVGGSTVLVTADGGMTWTSEFAGQDLSAVTCVNESDCIAGGWNASWRVGSAAVSTNGGATWQESVDDPPLQSLGCTSTFCVGSGLGIAFSSGDDGETWQHFGLPDDLDASLNSVVCLSTTTCIVVGQNLQGNTDPTATAAAFMTTDDGQEWTNISPSFPPATSGMAELACPSSDTCYALGYPNLDNDALVAAMTTDSGEDWTSVSGPTGVTLGMPYSFDDGFGFNGLSCYSTTACVVVGQGASGPAAAYTTDSATSWTLASSIG